MIQLKWSSGQKNSEGICWRRKDHYSIQLLLMNDSDFSLKISLIYFVEVTEEMFFNFDTQNKIDRNINIQFTEKIMHID